MTTKECNRCKQVKPFIEFAKSSSRKDGLQIQCKQCKVEQNRLKGYNKKWRIKYPERATQQSLKWAKANYETYSKIQKRYRKNNPKKIKQIADDYANIIPPGVYAIKCLVNKKMYIGESKYPIKRRSHHLSIAKSEKTLTSTNVNLQEDLQKYGKENFIFGIIEETPNHKQREKYWINYYQPEYND